MVTERSLVPRPAAGMTAFLITLLPATPVPRLPFTELMIHTTNPEPGGKQTHIHLFHPQLITVDARMQIWTSEDWARIPMIVRLKAGDHVEVHRPKLSSIIGEHVHDPVCPSQRHTRSICEAEFHILPLPIKFPGLLDRLLVDLQHYY